MLILRTYQWLTAQLAQKFPSIHYDLYITIKLICHLFLPKSEPHLIFVSTIINSVTGPN
jgi:hypothetical protein